MYCRHCGTRLSDEAGFCAECGVPQKAKAIASGGDTTAAVLGHPPSDSPSSTPPRAVVSPRQPWSERDSSAHHREYRHFAAQRSFTTPAVITLVLYLVLWLPGLIANLVYLQEANNVQRITGEEPEGKGCLVAMLVAFILLPIGACVMLTGGSVFSLLGSAAN